MSFEPKNDLETLLINAHAGVISHNNFMEKLMQEQLFMPIYEKHNIGGLQTSKKAQPLVLEDNEGCKVLILFSSPERATDFLKSYPEYGGGLLVELQWIAKRIGTGYSISLNPNWDIGIDLEANAIQQLTES